MQSVFGINNVALVGTEPKLLSLKEILEIFLITWPLKILFKDFGTLNLKFTLLILIFLLLFLKQF